MRSEHDNCGFCSDMQPFKRLLHRSTARERRLCVYTAVGQAGNAADDCRMYRRGEFQSAQRMPGADAELPAGAASRVLAENFSPNLFVSRMRAFITSDADPTGSRQYLKLFEVKAEGGALVDCGGSAADATEVTTDSCPILALATPAYLKDTTTLQP